MKAIKITAKKPITLIDDESMNRVVVDRGTILEFLNESAEDWFKFKDGFTGNIYLISKVEYKDCIERSLFKEI